MVNQRIKEGDTVRLIESRILNHTCPEGRINNSTAVVMYVYGEEMDHIRLQEDLHGGQFWNSADLEVVE